MTTIALLAFGTVFYRLVENWSLLDSFYFCVVTLSTVGFGDLAPDTGVAKAFTAFYILAGIGLIVAFANTYLSLVVKMREATGSDDGD
jgi:hypothetical protein